MGGRVSAWPNGIAALVVAALSLVSCSPDSDDRAAPTPTNNAAETDARETVRVPPLVDLPVVLAQEELRRLGLEFDVTRPRKVNECPLGTGCVSGVTLVVSAQYPYAGTSVSTNSVVILDVAKFVEDKE